MIAIGVGARWCTPSEIAGESLEPIARIDTLNDPRMTNFRDGPDAQLLWHFEVPRKGRGVALLLESEGEGQSAEVMAHADTLISVKVQVAVDLLAAVTSRTTTLGNYRSLRTTR